MSHDRKSLIIVGAGEFGQIAHEYFSVMSEYEVVGFAVEDAFLGENRTLAGLPIVGLSELRAAHPPGTVSVHVAVTYTRLNTVRVRLFEQLKSWGYAFASFISPNAFVWQNVVLGENVFIFENNVVQPFCKIEDCVVLWSGNHIGHQSVIKRGAYLSSHVVVSGYCTIGERSFVGVNSTFADHVTLAPDSFVSMSSSVTRSVTEADRVIKGSPAEVTKVSATRLMSRG